MKLRSFFAALIVAVLATVSLAMVAANAAGGESNDFSDVSAVHENVKAIEYLRDNGIVQGYEDGTFGPERDINRAEFLKIVMEASEYTPGGSDCYPDVHDEWFAQYVCAATENGLVEGYPNGLFRPEQPINFVEASKIVANTLGLELGEESDVWYEEFVTALDAHEATPVSIASFDQNVSRAEMSEMTWRILADRDYKPTNTFSQLNNGNLTGNELMHFDSCDQLHDFFEDNANEPWGYMEESDVDLPSSGAILKQQSMAEKGGGGEGLVGDYSSTNLQEEGVDEADIVKNDGNYIYTLKDQTVRIVDATPASGMKELDMIEFDENFWPNEMFLDGDSLVVIGSSWVDEYFDDFNSSDIDPYYYYSEGSVEVFVYDVSDPSDVSLDRRTIIEGDYSNSRKIDDTVYVVVNQWTNFWPWREDGSYEEEDLVPLYTDNGRFDKVVSCEDIMYMPESIDDTDYLIVMAIPLDPSEEVSSEVVMGRSSEIYASTENLYVTKSKYSWWGWYEEEDDTEETYIYKFSLDGADIEYEEFGTVPGTLLNQFSMDEHEGKFRIVTTLGDTWDEENPSVSNLYILNDALNTQGYVEGLAPGERVYSVRFVGDRAYVVTFKEVDPLFVFDLSNPSQPVVLGKLKIPGFSDYLHPFDENHIIGFGLDAEAVTGDVIDWWGGNFAWYQGVKMAMFDVTDINAPVELHREVIGDRGSRSELNYTHKALLWSFSKGKDGGALMAFPMLVAEISEEMKNDPDTEDWMYGDYTFQGAYVYDVSVEDGFQLRGTVTHYDEAPEESWEYSYGPNVINRVLYIGDVLYSVSDDYVKASDLDSLEDIMKLELEPTEIDEV